MANSTISITFKLDGDAKGFKDLTKGAEGLKTMLTQTISEAKQLKGNVINFAALSQGFSAISNSVQQFHGYMTNLSADYKTSVENETKLATVMKQRMEATDEDVEAIKRLTMEQRKLGVVDDDAQIAGAQQMGTFLKQKSSLDVLIPAMNNLIAQQKGMNATGQDAVTIGNMIGKVMGGQTSALKRVGISFSEAEENVLKYGNESERAAMLAQIIANNVGNMNEEMGKLPIAETQDLEFAFGDMKDALAEMVNGAEPFLEIGAQAGMAASGVGTFITGIKTLTAAMTTNLKTFALSTAAYVKNKAAMIATTVATKAVAAATALWTGAQKLLNMVLTMNPIGMVVAAVGALTAAVIYAYNHFEGFRKICLKVWEVIEPLADAIMNGLTKALSWLVEKAQQAWEWLKNLLGLGGKKVEITASVKTEKSPELIALENKYKDFGTGEKTSMGGGKASASHAAAAEKVYNPYAKTLKDIRTNIEILDEKLLNSTKEQAASILMVKAAWEEEEDAIMNAGKAMDDNTEKAEENTLKWKENAVTLRDIEGNISILKDRLQDASLAEAAGINRQIDLWNQKRDAILNAGKAVKEQGMTMKAALEEGWHSTKGFIDELGRLQYVFSGGGNMWDKMRMFIDSIFSITQKVSAFSKFIGKLDNLVGAKEKANEKTTESDKKALTATVVTTAAQIAASEAQIVANKKEQESFMKLAASKFFAAHASIPFVGFGIGAGFTAGMTKMIEGLQAFANGGIVSGPTLALVGEYGGAASNPEVIAPLDKLQNMIGNSGNGGDVRFKIEGRDLVGILNKESNRTRRS